MSRQNDGNGEGGGENQYNMWTSPSSKPSPSLAALERLRGDEKVSISQETREEIKRRVRVFERQELRRNGENILP